MKRENNLGWFWQWDTGCRIIAEGSANRADFLNTAQNQVVSVSCQDGSFPVPDSCLQDSGDLTVFLVSAEPAGQQTVRAQVFRIKPRPKPDDYIYTPQEFDSYTLLKAQLDAKLTVPAGGETGQVLTKTVEGFAWTNSGGGGAGTTFYPTVSTDGVLSWHNELGLPNPEPINLRGSQGNDGFTPTISVAAVEEGYAITVTNRDSASTVILPKGVDGGTGSQGATFTPHLSEEGILSWSNDKGLTNPAPICIRGADGAPGPQGAQGIPGATGAQGEPGTPGEAGRTPVKGVDYFTDDDLAQIRQGLLPLSGGTMTGSLDLGGNKLKSLSLPTDAQDAATKGYVDSAKLIFTDVSVQVSQFLPDAAYPDYPFKAELPLPGVTQDHIPQVVFGVEDAAYGSFAPAAVSYNGGICIWAAAIPDADLRIPTIIAWRA